jgi:hypothetical protein
MQHHFTGTTSYFVGDPCCVVAGELLSDKLTAIKQNLRPYQDAVVQLDEHFIWVVRLPDHDTAFQDQNGVGYSTDSGLFAVLPMELIDEPAGEEFGTMLTGHDPLNVSYLDGNLLVGDISIVFREP